MLKQWDQESRKVGNDNYFQLVNVLLTNQTLYVTNHECSGLAPSIHLLLKSNLALIWPMIIPPNFKQWKYKYHDFGNTFPAKNDWNNSNPRLGWNNGTSCPAPLTEANVNPSYTSDHPPTCTSQKEEQT